MRHRSFLRFCMILVGLFVPWMILFLSGQRALSQVVTDERGKISLDVPYEPSSEEIVQVMLQIARVVKEDIVYDLGCGDGRIVIAAARQTGARGVGVDLDPERIKESLANARKANVADRIRFLQQDLFRTDIGEATVIMLYLWPEVNLKLRPKLLRELRPGTRVVSHSHNMGNWKPDQSTAAGGHRIYFWEIPANVTGVWEWGAPGEKKQYVMKLGQQFQGVSGTLQFGSDEIPVRNLELRGSQLQFIAERFSEGRVQTLRFTGRVQGHFIEGTAEEMPTGSGEKQPWKAKRDPSSILPLD